MSATQHAVTRPVRQIMIRNNAGIYEACLIQRRPDLQFTQTPASKTFEPPIKPISLSFFANRSAARCRDANRKAAHSLWANED